MAETFNKKEREKKKNQRKKEKQLKRDARKENAEGSRSNTLDSMLAYVDENGVIRDTPPDLNAKREVKADSIEIGIPKREEGEIDRTISGVINYFDETKGYGFIKTPNGESFFVHQNNITGIPKVGKEVLFEKERNAKGWAAVKVQIL